MKKIIYQVDGTKIKKLKNNEINPEEFMRIFTKCANELKRVPGLKDDIDDIEALVEMVQSYCNREYKDVPKRTIIAIIFAVVYKVSPIDILPDYIPVIGGKDDEIVMKFLLKYAKEDLKTYKAWKKLNK